jgi:hypothetical protein
MSWSKQNFAISSGVWIGGHITMEDYGWLKTHRIKENKAKVARTYKKNVKLKEFQVRDLVWEAVLPLGTKDTAYGKWSLDWHGLIELTKSCPKTHICLRSWTVSSSQ